MKSILLRLWQWLGRLLGQDTKESDELRATSDESGTIAAPPVAPPVTLPPPLPPQMDLHAGETAQFGRKASLLTKPEGKLYRSLLSAVAGDYEVMSKVRLWDFIWLLNEPPDRKQHLNRLSCRHVDFLLCTPGALKPLLVIELDDKSHQTPYAIENDRYKNELFTAAGLPLLRLPHANFPPRQLRAKLEEAMDLAS